MAKLDGAVRLRQIRSMGRISNIVSLTPQEEQYADLLALGWTQAKAFKSIWPHAQKWKPESVYVKASRVAAKVWPRVEEISEQSRIQTIVNLRTLTEQTDRDHDLAHETKNASAAVSATKLKAQLHKRLDREPSGADYLRDVTELLNSVDRLARTRRGDDAVDVTPDE